MYDPIEHPAAARQRRNLVIDEMVDQGYVSPESGRVAKSRRLLPKDRRPGLRTANRIQPYFVDYVIQQLERKYGERAFTGGFQVYTTLDLAEQETGREGAAVDAQGQGARGLAGLHRAQHGQGAGDGRRSAYGDGPESQFNIATSGQRQPGSALQALRAAGGLEDGIQTSTHFTLGQAALRPRQPPDLVRHELHARRTRARSTLQERHDARRTTRSTRS